MKMYKVLLDNGQTIYQYASDKLDLFETVKVIYNEIGILAIQELGAFK